MLSSLSLTLTPRPQESGFWQIESLFLHGPTYRLQTTESGCIMVSQKNSRTLKYLHVVAKEDPQARTVGGRVISGCPRWFTT